MEGSRNDGMGEVWRLGGKKQAVKKEDIRSRRGREIENKGEKNCQAFLTSLPPITFPPVTFSSTSSTHIIIKFSFFLSFDFFPPLSSP